MLKIRNAQFGVLENALIAEFSTRVCQQLRIIVPDNQLLVTDAELSHAVKYGIERAKKFGFITEKDVFKFVTAMVIFGTDFDSGESYKLFKQSLDFKNGRQTYFRADSLYKDAMQYIEASPEFRIESLQIPVVKESDL